MLLPPKTKDSTLNLHCLAGLFVQVTLRLSCREVISWAPLLSKCAVVCYGCVWSSGFGCESSHSRSQHNTSTHENTSRVLSGKH